MITLTVMRSVLGSMVGQVRTEYVVGLCLKHRARRAHTSWKSGCVKKMRAR